MQRWYSDNESESLHALEASFDRFQQHLDRGMAVQIANDGTCLCYILIYQFLFIFPSVTHINLNVTLNNLVYAENCNWKSLPLRFFPLTKIFVSYFTYFYCTKPDKVPLPPRRQR